MKPQLDGCSGLSPDLAWSALRVDKVLLVEAAEATKAQKHAHSKNLCIDEAQVNMSRIISSALEMLTPLLRPQTCDPNAIAVAKMLRGQFATNSSIPPLPFRTIFLEARGELKL